MDKYANSNCDFNLLGLLEVTCVIITGMWPAYNRNCYLLSILHFYMVTYFASVATFDCIFITTYQC